ncbi:MAG: radical SAM protein [Planctomycetota bacterium]
MTEPAERHPLRSIYYYQTTCNLQCRHCWLGPGLSRPGKTEKAALSLESFNDMLEQGIALGLKQIKFTGGEPFCDGGFMQKIEAARARNLRVSIETNATLVTRTLSRDLRRLGVDFIALSLDGADPESHDAQRGAKGAFRETMAGLQALMEARFHPQVIYTPTVSVLSRTAEIITLLNRFQISSLKINSLSMIGKGGALRASGKAPALKDYLLLNHEISSGRIAGKGYPVLFDIPPAFQSMGRILRKAPGWCGIKNILGVLSDGRISICGVGLVNERLVLGRLETDGLEAIWKNHDTITTLRHGLPHQLKGICGDCAMKRLCLGKCRAEAYVAEEDLMAPNPFCSEADRQGLFPVTRRISRIKAG